VGYVLSMRDNVRQPSTFPVDRGKLCFCTNYDAPYARQRATISSVSLTDWVRPNVPPNTLYIGHIGGRVFTGQMTQPYEPTNSVKALKEHTQN